MAHLVSYLVLSSTDRVEAHKAKDLVTNAHSRRVFCNVEVLIYVFEVEGQKTEKEKGYYYSCLERIAQCSPSARIFCIIHKMDLIPEDQRNAVSNPNITHAGSVLPN